MLSPRTSLGLLRASLHLSPLRLGVTQSGIEQRLRDHFKPNHLEVQNESFMHNVPKGSESHFRVVIVSDHFEGLNTLKRHRAINHSLQEYFERIHALAIEAYTLAQWVDMEQKSDRASPKCRGGSKL